MPSDNCSACKEKTHFLTRVVSGWHTSLLLLAIYLIIQVFNMIIIGKGLRYHNPLLEQSQNK